MPKFLDLMGKKFGRLTAIRRLPRDLDAKHTDWECICECGNTMKTRVVSLTSGNTTSCGCYQKEISAKHAATMNSTHGLSKHPLFWVWNAMKERCTNPKNANYANYLGRGISICERWLESPQNFFDDMGPRPEGGTLERKNNDLGYSPENCIWATSQVQARNKRSNRFETFLGETKTRTDWAAEFNIELNTLQRRLNSGWSIEKALLTPVQKQFRNTRAKPT